MNQNDPQGYNKLIGFVDAGTSVSPSTSTSTSNPSTSTTITSANSNTIGNEGQQEEKRVRMSDAERERARLEMVGRSADAVFRDVSGKFFFFGLLSVGLSCFETSPSKVERISYSLA